MTDAKPETLSRTVLILLLLVCLGGITAVVILVAKPGEKQQETIISVVETPSPSEAKVNVLDVVDAMTNATVTAVEGQRYKVLVTDEAREGASGIARIGGLVTFVPNTRRGDVVIIEVVRLKRSTADAIVINKIESGYPVPTRTDRPHDDRRDTYRDAAPSEMVGKTFRDTITDTGREGDGVAHVEGKVVFVKGAALGEHVEFIITEDAGRFARADVVSKSDVPFEPPSTAPARNESVPNRAPVGDVPVTIGEEREVTVTENDRRNPGVDGVARIDNFVVFVPGTKIGDRVRIKITGVRARAADGEVLERLDATAPAP